MKILYIVFYKKRLENMRNNWLKTKFVPIDDFIIEDATMFGWKVRVIEGMGTNIRLVRKLELENIKVEIKELEVEIKELENEQS